MRCPVTVPDLRQFGAQKSKRADPFTRLIVRQRDLGERAGARRSASTQLGVKGAQVQILSSRLAFSQVGGLCVPETMSPLRDLRVFVDEAAESIASGDAGFASGDNWFGLGESAWRPLSEGSMRPVTVVVLRVLVEDEAEVALSGDQDAVGGLASA